MRKFILAILATSVVFLGGCAGTPSPTVTVTASPPPVVQVDPNQALFDAYALSGLPLNAEQKAILVDLAGVVCESLDSGYSFDQIAESLFAGSQDADMSAAIIYASVTAICPQYSNAMKSWAAGLSV